MPPSHARRAILLAFLLLALASEGTLFLGELGGGGSLAASVFNGAGLVGGLNQAKTELSGSGVRDDPSVIDAIAAIINFVLLFAAIFAFVAFIVAGFIFILGFGSDQANQRAKKIMIWSAVGLVVIIFAFVLTKFIVALATAP